MAPSAGSQGSTARDLAMGSLLLLALGPAWGELFRHIEVEIWAGYVLWVPLLLLWAAASWPRDPAHPLLGMGLLLAALGVELAALVAGPERAGRLALPLGALGISALLGRPPRRFAPLALFLVPIPFGALRLASPGLESLWLRGGAARSRALDHPGHRPGTGAGSPGGVLGLSPADGGLPLAALFAALGCFAAARAGRPPLAALGRGLLWAPLALPVQALAVGVAVPLASAGHAPAARAWLDYGLPLGCACAGLGLVAWGGVGGKAQARDLAAGALG